MRRAYAVVTWKVRRKKKGVWMSCSGGMVCSRDKIGRERKRARGR